MTVVPKHNVTATVMLDNNKGIPVVVKAGRVGISVIEYDFPVTDREHWGAGGDKNVNPGVVTAKVASAYRLSNLVMWFDRPKNCEYNW